MSELLQFMYQGVVNVKHTDLSSFMKIAQALQIKGLATSMQKPPSSPIQSNNSICSKNSALNSSENFSSNNVIETKINTALFSNKSGDNLPVTSSSSGGGNGGSGGSGGTGAGTSSSNKRSVVDYSEPVSIYPKKQLRRTSESGGENDISAESMDNISSDEVFLPPIPQISMVESSRFDLNNVKRENTEPILSPGAMRNIVPPPFNFEYNNSLYSSNSKNVEYPNDLHMNNEFSKNSGAGGNSGSGSSGANHMDIPAGIFIISQFLSLFFCLFKLFNVFNAL